MELFVEAEKNYEEKRFQSAYQCYRQCLENKNLDKKTMTLCCQKIVKLSELLNIPREEGLLARSFFCLAEYGEAVEYGEAAIAKKKSREAYEILWESYLQEGNLIKAEGIAESYLIYCKNKRLCDLGLDFIKKLKQRGLANGQCAVTGTELEIMRGNKEIVIEKLNELCRWYGENKDIPRKIVDEINYYQRCINLYKKYWESESVVREIFLKHWQERLRNHDILETDTIERKKIIYFVLIDFLLEGGEFGTTLEAYAHFFERDGLLASMNEYKNKECSSENKRNHLVENAGLVLKKNILKENINNVVEKIRSHDFFSKHQRKSDMEIFLDGLNDVFLSNNADNLLVCLIDMELYESALKFIDKMKGKTKKESVEYQVNMVYMEIVALEKLGRCYQAMDRIDDTLTMLPVNKEERDTLQKKKIFLMERISLSKDAM